VAQEPALALQLRERLAPRARALFGHRPPTDGDRRWFVQVVCVQGAYQSTQLLYLVDRGLNKVGPISLHTYRDLGKGKPKLVRERFILGTLDFNPRTGRLAVLDKFRGAGDCGIYSVFQLKKTYFIPRAIRAKLNCNGKGPYDPSHWPQLPAPHRP
jgi:hypothetical protein